MNEDLFYWSLFLITAPVLSEETSWDYVPIASFSSRIECEAALEHQRKTLALHTGSEESYSKCLKTDEIVPDTALPFPKY